ncbi:MAG: Hsp20/alpha crystallin family protein, partial [Flammeovirgaceae bacterium]|nr:Hsp20/alpha crystallin family protein [Flammeovirgaceae bacterium]MDW8288679.1 Hsp20/alpha crystallin family protein [Flammeovirgaceae bacterium]
MSIIKYHPFANSLANRIWGNDFMPSFSKLFEDFFNDDFGTWTTVPAVNIKENEKEFSLEFAAPGKAKEDFKIEVDENILKVSSEKKEEQEEKDEKGRYTRKEFSYHSFVRSFRLPDNVDVDKIEAN